MSLNVLKLLLALLITVCIALVHRLEVLFQLGETNQLAFVDGPKDLPLCRPFSATLLRSYLPIDIPNSKVVYYEAVQQLLVGMPQKRHQIDTGIGLVPLRSGEYVSMSRRIPFDKWTKDDPHMCMQVMQLYHGDLQPKHGSQCMFLYGSDVRIFTYKGDIWGYTHLKQDDSSTNILLYNTKTTETFKIVVETLKDYGKNWMPFESRGELYFIHSLEPRLVIVHVGLHKTKSFAQTRVGKVPVIYGTLLYGITPQTSKKVLRRGSTPGFRVYRTNIILGIGHITKMRDRDNENRGSQVPFIWYFDFSDASPVVKYIEMELKNDHGGHKRYIYPLSLFYKDNELYMTATDSYYNWFSTHVQKSPFALSEVRNMLYKIYLN